MTEAQIAHIEKRLDGVEQDVVDDLWREEFLARADAEADMFEVPC